MTSEPPWARTPLSAKFREELRTGGWTINFGGGRQVQTGLRKTYKIDQSEVLRIAEEQRRRARELAHAMGFRGEISDNHAGKIIEVLGPFIPGLTITPPSDIVSTPDWLGARWNAPKVGAKIKWTDDRKRALLTDVERLKEEGRAQTDKEALTLVLTTITQEGGQLVSVERLQNLLAEARRPPRE